MNHSSMDQTIALAALLQSCYLVDQLSKTGNAPREDMRPLLDSLFVFSPDSAEQVYTNTRNVKLGMTILHDILSGKTASGYSEALRYAMGILHLEKKLRNDPDMLKIVRNRLEHIAFRADHFSDHIDTIAPAVAAVYQDTLSTLKYRIQVSGSMRHLQDQQVADKIRSLLFSAVRAAILWRQVGGRRWHFLLKRRRILESSRQLKRDLDG